MVEAPGDEAQWESGWDGHRRAQMLRFARLTLAEKLDWLEEAQRLVETLRRGRGESAGKPPS